MNHNHGKAMTKLLAAALIAALISPGLPVVHASNSSLREELLNRREEAAQNSASSNKNQAAATPTTSYDTAEEEPERPDGTIVIPETQRPSLSQESSLGGFQYQGNSKPGNNTSPGNKDHISSSALDALYRTQIQALSDALPEGTSLEVALKDAGPQYQKALQAAQMIAETENIKVFDINLKKEDGSTMHQLDDYVEVTMNIPNDYVIAEENTIVVHYLSEEGETEPCETVYHGEDPNNRYLTFRTDHFSVYFFMEATKEQAKEIFSTAGMVTAGASTDTLPEATDNNPTLLIAVAAAVVVIGAAAAVGIVLKKKKQTA